MLPEGFEVHFVGRLELALLVDRFPGEALEARPEKDRSLKEYTSVLNRYRRVYLITPRAAEVPAALNQVAVLYRVMGDL